MKKHTKILLSTLSAVLIIFLILLVIVSDGLSEADVIQVEGINLTDIQDGEYTGSFNFKRWSTSVQMQIRDHTIVSIKVLDDVTAAWITNCSDEMFNRVITAQNTKVDAVSGATITSKAYLKAIENALTPNS